MQNEISFLRSGDGKRFYINQRDDVWIEIYSGRECDKVMYVREGPMFREYISHDGKHSYFVKKGKPY